MKKRSSSIGRFVPAAEGGKKHALPLRLERKRTQIPISEALRRLGEPSAELEKLGILPAALEAGAKIRLARLNKGLTQAHLARLAGISQPALSDIENGKGSDGPSYATMRQLATALDIELMPLGTRSESETVALSVSTAPADEEDEVQTHAPELANVSSLVRDLVDTKTLSEMRALIAKPLRKKLEAVSSRIFTVHGYQSAQLRVGPMTTLVSHGNTFSPADERTGQHFTFGGADQHVAMVRQGGLLEMSNHGAETVVVFTVPPKTLLEM